MPKDNTTTTTNQDLIFPKFPEYDEDDLLDWDAHIATPPPRKSGTIRVKLKYVGRSKPMPLILDDCDCEGCANA